MGFLAGKKTTNFNWGNFLKFKFDHELCCPVSCIYPVKNPSVDNYHGGINRTQRHYNVVI